jgi:hypothetical protein
MTQHHPVVWLRTRATTGLKDMPSNAAWLARKAQRSSTMALGRATDAVSGAGSSVGEGIGYARPDNGSVEALIDAAHRASQGARAAEDKALKLAEEAKRAANEANRESRPPAGNRHRARRQGKGPPAGLSST